MLQARKEFAGERSKPAIGRAAGPAPLRKFRPSAQPRRRGKAIQAAILVCCFFLGLVTIAQYSFMVSMHYQISRAEARLSENREEYRRLEIEAAELGSLGRIEHLARTELGMREPDSSQFRVLTAGQEDSSGHRE